MHTTRPPLGTPPDGGRLHLSRAVRLAFDGPAEVVRRPEHRRQLRRYLSDLVAPYHLALREELFVRPEGQSYGEMAAALIAATVTEEQPVDLLLLAYAVPDVRPGRATATYLSEICPGRPFAFAVSDQGAAAGFTALRLAREYVRSGDCRRALVLVVEQATLHYPPPSPVALPGGHTGVALLCEVSPTGGAAVGAVVGPIRHHTEVDPDQAAARVAEAGSEAADGATLVLGSGLAGLPHPRSDRVRVASAARPQTGVWWELAGEWETVNGSPRVLLAEYDPSLRYLCQAQLG